MTPATADALRAALGESAVSLEPCEAMADVAATGRVRATSSQSISRALELLGDAGAQAWPGAGRSKQYLGNLPGSEGERWWLDCSGLSGIDRFEPDEGVMQVRAGTKLRELHAAAASEGWEVPLDVTSEGATLGGAIAAASAGPRTQGFGPVRDAVLGLEVVLAGGEITHCGGRVVKNVTGFDLGKLYTGSLGTLGVIASAWIRLWPRPRRVEQIALRVGSAPFASETDARQALEISRASTLRACIWLSPQAAARMGAATAWHLVAELGGEDAAVERDLHTLGGAGERTELGPQPLDAWIKAWATPARQAVRAQLRVLPSKLCELQRQLAALALDRAALAIAPALGQVELEVSAGNLSELGGSTVAQTLSRAAVAGRGTARIEAAPCELKLNVDVFDIDAGAARLMRSVKQRFDPRNTLSPGRVLRERDLACP